MVSRTTWLFLVVVGNACAKQQLQRRDVSSDNAQFLWGQMFSSSDEGTPWNSHRDPLQLTYMVPPVLEALWLCEVSHRQHVTAFAQANCMLPITQYFGHWVAEAQRSKRITEHMYLDVGQEGVPCECNFNAMITAVHTELMRGFPGESFKHWRWRCFRFFQRYK